MDGSHCFQELVATAPSEAHHTPPITPEEIESYIQDPELRMTEILALLRRWNRRIGWRNAARADIQRECSFDSRDELQTRWCSLARECDQLYDEIVQKMRDVTSSAR